MHCGRRVTLPTLAQVCLSPFSSWPSRGQRYEANLKMDLSGLELKLHKVHLAVKFSKAEAKENLTAKCTKCSFNPMSTRRLPSTPCLASLARCTWQFARGHWVETALCALGSQVLLSLDCASASGNLTVKCTSCSFKSPLSCCARLGRLEYGLRRT